MSKLHPSTAGLGAFVLGIAIAGIVGACCPEATQVVWELLPGTHPVYTDIPQDNLHGDNDYQVTISQDLGQAIETYTRNGKAYRAVYTLGPGVPNEMRANSNLANE
jgi:hypothetical protein